MQAFSTVYAVDIYVDGDGEIVILQFNPDGDSQRIYVPLDRSAAFRRAFDAAVKQAKAEESL